MRTRNKSIPIRVTEKELEAIDEAAKKAKKNRTEYLISAALGKEITVIEDLREMIVQLKKIGNNLNQLTRKANAHEVEVVDLTETNNASGCIAPSGNACTAQEYKGFAMQPKTEWHEKAIKWFIEVMNK